MSRCTVPASIRRDGSADVTGELNAWLASLPDTDQGRTWGLLRPGTYRCDSTVLLSGKRGVTLDGRGATIVCDVPAPAGMTDPHQIRARAHVRIIGSQRVSVHRLNVRGPNANGGTDSGAYVESLEAQHAFDIQGSDRVLIADCEASNVYGDICYAGVTHCSHVYIHRVHGHHNGRQGVGVTNADHVTVRWCDLHDIRHSHVDLEPAAAAWWVDGVTVSDNTFGSKRLTWIAAKGVGKVDHVTVENNSVDAPANIVEGASDGTRRSGWTVRGNVASRAYGSPTGHVLGFDRIDGLTVENNTIPCQAGRSMYLVAATDCTAVDVRGNTFPGGVGELAP